MNDFLREIRASQSRIMHCFHLGGLKKNPDGLADVKAAALMENTMGNAPAKLARLHESLVAIHPNLKYDCFVSGVRQMECQNSITAHIKHIEKLQARYNNIRSRAAFAMAFHPRLGENTHVPHDIAEIISEFIRD